MKRVFIIHGWGGYPEEAWFLWLKGELEKRGIQAVVPQMPDASAPVIEKWVPYLAELVGTPDTETFLIGHSIGVSTIMRYLERIDSLIGGVVGVAGWFNLIPGSIGGPEEEAIAKPWLETMVDTEKIKVVCPKFTAIFSDNDPYVPISDAEIFRKRLNAKIIIEHNRGHMGGSDNLKEFPLVLEEILEMMK
jgi:predicted alpha/beta hydrolase family esterase